MVWSRPPSGPLSPSVNRRFSHGGWPTKKPWKRPPMVPPTPLLPLRPFPVDSSSSSYTPSTSTIIPGVNHAESSGMVTAWDRSSAMAPVRSQMARFPVGRITSRPSSMWWLPCLPSKFATGVILCACCACNDDDVLLSDGAFVSATAEL